MAASPEENSDISDDFERRRLIWRKLIEEGALKNKTPQELSETHFVAIDIHLALGVLTGTAWASSFVIENCIDIGLEQQLVGCLTNAKMGIQAQAVVLHARGTEDWLIISAG